MLMILLTFIIKNRREKKRHNIWLASKEDHKESSYSIIVS